MLQDSTKLHSQHLMQAAGITLAALVVGTFTWLLLVPDPYATSRAFEPIRNANISGYLIHPCVYFLMTSMALINVFSGNGRTIRTLVVLLVFHGLCTEMLQHFIPGRSCDPLDAVANLSGISIGFAFDKFRRGLSQSWSQLIQLALH